MLFIYPPVARSTEAPPGLARLAGSLRSIGYRVRCLDLNQEGFDWLLSFDPGSASFAKDTWTRGALARRDRNLALLRNPAGYPAFDTYKRAVLDLNRSLRIARSPHRDGTTTQSPLVTLADFQDPLLSPLCTADLLASASKYEENIYFPLFSRRVEEALEELRADRGGGMATPAVAATVATARVETARVETAKVEAARVETKAKAAATVGISLVYLSQALVAFAIAGWLRDTHPEIHVVMGGGLVTSWIRQGSLAPDSALNTLVDAFLPGPGEESLAAWLGEKSPLPAECPDYDDFPLDSYFSPGRTLAYGFSTGCPWRRCIFCPEKAEGNPFRGMAPALSMSHLRSLAERYRPVLFHFTDNEITPASLRALVDEPPGVPWYGFARFSRELTDPAFCARLAQSGCALLQLGLESGDQNVLDALGKGTRIEEIVIILDNLKTAGIATYLYVLFGTPSETRESALVTRNFLESHADRIGFINAAIFNMPIAGEESVTCETLSFYEGDLSLYCSFRHPSGWNRAAVRSFLKSDFGSSPGIRTILARTPPLFTSNHAPFFPLRS